jgi:hypothetical protein
MSPDGTGAVSDEPPLADLAKPVLPKYTQKEHGKYSLRSEI